MGWSDVKARLQTQTRDALELVLLPGLAAVLPWPLAFALFKRMARWPWLYRQSCERALQEARKRIPIDDEAQWLAERRLVTLVDHADHYLARARGDAWMRRYVDVQGQWQAEMDKSQGPAPGFLMTFHWGCGMWALRHARASGLAPHAISAPPNLGPDAWRRVLRRYVLARLRTVELALGRPVLYLPGVMQGVLGAMGRREQVLAVMDVPADQAEATRAARVLGRAVQVPALLPRLAVRRKWAVTVYSLALDVQTGRRLLRLHPLGVMDDEQALSDRIFALFDELLRERPAAWHFWSEAPRFFQDAGREEVPPKALLDTLSNKEQKKRGSKRPRSL